MVPNDHIAKKLASLFSRAGINAIPKIHLRDGQHTWDFSRYITITSIPVNKMCVHPVGPQIDNGHDLPMPPTAQQLIAKAASSAEVNAELPPPTGTVLTLQFTFPFEGRRLPWRFIAACRAIEGDPMYYSEEERIGIRRVLDTFDHRRSEHSLLLAFGLMLQAREVAVPNSPRQILWVDARNPTQWSTTPLAKRQSPDIWLGMWLVMGIVLLDGLGPPDLGPVPFQKWLEKRANTRIRSLTFAKVGLGHVSKSGKKNLRCDLALGAWIPTPAFLLRQRWLELRELWQSRNYKQAFLMVYDDDADVQYLGDIACLSHEVRRAHLVLCLHPSPGLIISSVVVQFSRAVQHAEHIRRLRWLSWRLITTGWSLQNRCHNDCASRGQWRVAIIRAKGGCPRACTSVQDQVHSAPWSSTAAQPG